MIMSSIEIAHLSIIIEVFVFVFVSFFRSVVSSPLERHIVRFNQRSNADFFSLCTYYTPLWFNKHAQLYSIKKKLCEETFCTDKIQFELNCVYRSHRMSYWLQTLFENDIFCVFSSLFLSSVAAHTHTQTANCGKFVWKKRNCCGMSCDIDSKSSNLLPMPRGMSRLHNLFSSFAEDDVLQYIQITSQSASQPDTGSSTHTYTHESVNWIFILIKWFWLNYFRKRKAFNRAMGSFTPDSIIEKRRHACAKCRRPFPF